MRISDGLQTLLVGIAISAIGAWFWLDLLPFLWRLTG